MDANTLNQTSVEELTSRVIFCISCDGTPSAAMAPFITIGLVDRLHCIASGLSPTERCGMKVQEVLAHAISNVTGTPIDRSDAEMIGNDAAIRDHQTDKTVGIVDLDGCVLWRTNMA